MILLLMAIILFILFFSNFFVPLFNNDTPFKFLTVFMLLDGISAYMLSFVGVRKIISSLNVPLIPNIDSIYLVVAATISLLISLVLMLKRTKKIGMLAGLKIVVLIWLGVSVFAHVFYKTETSGSLNLLAFWGMDADLQLPCDSPIIITKSWNMTADDEITYKCPSPSSLIYVDYYTTYPFIGFGDYEVFTDKTKRLSHVLHIVYESAIKPTKDLNRDN